MSDCEQAFHSLFSSRVVFLLAEPHRLIIVMGPASVIAVTIALLKAHMTQFFGLMSQLWCLIFQMLNRIISRVLAAFEFSVPQMHAV